MLSSCVAVVRGEGVVRNIDGKIIAIKRREKIITMTEIFGNFWNENNIKKLFHYLIELFISF